MGTAGTVAALTLASLAVQAPFLRRGISLLDEGSILVIAEALASGERLYSDRVTPLAPLTYELLAALFRLFGPSLEVARSLQTAVFSACTLLTWGILRPLAGPRAALAGALAFLALKPLGFPLWTIVNYSQLAMLFCLAALFLLVLHLRRGGAWALLGAGLCVGLTAVTKQNLGALMAVVVGGTALFALRERSASGLPRPLPGLAMLALGIGLPIAATAVLFAVRGTLPHLVERAVVGLFGLADPYFVALPGLAPWTFDPTSLGPRLFAYYPSPLVGMVLEGALELAASPLWLAVEYAVKLAFYLPVLLVAAGTWRLSRQIRQGAPRTDSAAFLAILLFAALSYASMLYRADWTHLTNIYPAVILLGVVLGARAGSLRHGLSLVPAGLLALFLLAGLALAILVLSAYRAPLSTARGTLLGLPTSAGQTRVVLDWLEQQPDGAPVAVLPAHPLIYFLAERRVPIPFDLVVPGVLTERDDARLAERLEELSLALYDPRPIPSMPTPLPDYAPRTSAVLARGFRVERALTGSALVLERRAEPQAPPELRDLWREVAASASAPGTEDIPSLTPASWLYFRVLERPEAARGPHCAWLRHTFQDDHELRFTPMLAPASWALVAPGSLAARFRVAVRRGAEAWQTLWVDDVGAGPPREVRVAIGPLAADTATLALCIEPAGGKPLPFASAFAEPRIVTAEAAPLTGERPQGAGQRP